MSIERELEKILMHRKAEKCESCNNKMQYVGSGRYRCVSCGKEMLDDFGKIKSYLEDYGPTPEVLLAQQTGVNRDKIDQFLKKGMVELRDGGTFYLKCEMCGCDIRSGRYCASCARKTAESNHQLKYEEIGERPTQSSAMSGKMHFINRRGN